MRKREGKTEDLIKEKPLKLGEKIRRKTDHLYVALQEVKNLQNLAKKTMEENLMLIGDRDKFFGSKPSAQHLHLRPQKALF